MGRKHRTALILRAQLGDFDALNHLLLVTTSDARGYARRQCRLSHIDDAVEEALLVLGRRNPALKIAAAVSGRLYTILKPTCDRLAQFLFDGERDEERRIETYLSARTDLELRAELAAAFGSLPMRHRQAIIMRDFKELTTSEISARLHEPPSAIRRRLRRARAMVREYFVGDVSRAIPRLGLHAARQRRRRSSDAPSEAATGGSWGRRARARPEQGAGN